MAAGAFSRSFITVFCYILDEPDNAQVKPESVSPLLINYPKAEYETALDGCMLKLDEIRCASSALMAH